MLGIPLVFIVGSITWVSGVLSDASLKSSANCQDVSKDVDQWIFQSNYAITTGGDDTLIVDGFQTTMRLYVLGIPTPFKVHMEVSDGQLSSMDQMNRISPVFLCINSTTTNYTSGLFQYKDMKIAYKQMKAKFLFWEMKGKFSYEFEPELNLVIKKINDPLDIDCSPVKPLTLASTGPSDYVIEADNSWKSWFLKKLLHHALVNDDNTPMLQYFLERTWVSIDVNYCRFSC